jgi:hypothetical protein
MAIEQRLAAKKVELIGELRRILRAVRPGDAGKFDGVGLLIEQVCDPKTLTYELSPVRAASAFYAYDLFRKVPPNEQDAYTLLGQNVQRLLMDIGYRGNIGTYQENMIMGGTQSEEHAKKPYIPVGILEGKLGVEETRQARRLSIACTAWDTYYGLTNHSKIPVSLEPLDEEGRTLRDPRPVDMEKLAEAYPGFRADKTTFEQLLDGCAIPGLQSIPAFPFRRPPV